MNSLWSLKYLINVSLLFVFQKRQLSAQSLAFNLKDKVFCELFPDVVDVSMKWVLTCCCLYGCGFCWSNVFPSLFRPPQEIKQKQKAQEELSTRTQPLPLPDVVPDGDPQQAHYGLPAINGGPIPLGGANPAPGLQQANRNHGLLGGALANLFVIVGFAAFAYTVKYVLRSIAQEWEAEPPCRQPS